MPIIHNFIETLTPPATCDGNGRPAVTAARALGDNMRDVTLLERDMVEAQRCLETGLSPPAFDKQIFCPTK